MAIELSKGDFAKKIEKGVALVDFYAPWCGPCKMMLPIIDELSHDMKGKAGVYKVNVDTESELASAHQVFSIPTIILFKDGKAVDQTTGAQSKENLIKMIEKQVS